MKKLTLTTIGTVAAVLAFSTGCSQSKIDALNTELDYVRTDLDGCRVDLADAKEAQKVAEDEKTLAQEEAEVAKEELRNAKKKLNDAEREMNVAQDQSETAYVNLHKAQQALKTQWQRADRHEAASKDLRTMYSLKATEYAKFVEKAAQELAAKDKKINELSAPVK